MIDDKPNSQLRNEWVEPKQFLELAVSNRRLWRCDRHGVLGLLDRDTGMRYLVSSETFRSSHADSVPAALS